MRQVLIASLSTNCAMQEDGGVRKEIIQPGSGWEQPESGDKVRGGCPQLAPQPEGAVPQLSPVQIWLLQLSRCCAPLPCFLRS